MRVSLRRIGTWGSGSGPVPYFLLEYLTHALPGTGTIRAVLDMHVVRWNAACAIEQDCECFFYCVATTGTYTYLVL